MVVIYYVIQHIGYYFFLFFRIVSNIIKSIF
nr:MAG TPA: hypothetical protein [Bacteriophage sp.]DAJ07009.1 MAG TPA: hypothetical protein [Caudoviricetes sp.]DAM82350.1 MAG TPA: hypothetical protein [Caudoviricetes sp.]DAQ90515.1 MAG TPA: hypothetical protein [Caudoviricetes sp.]